MKKKITIKEVAATSGVSIATVSQILNGNAEKFSPKTVEKVMNAKNSLDYQPDYFAQRMVMKKSKTIGVMIPDITNPFFAILLKGIEKVVYGQKYIVMLCDADFSVQKESEYLQELIRRGVDGFIIASSTVSNQTLREQLSKNQIPYIVLDQKKSEGGSDEISTDDFTGGVVAAKHLRELGHEKVAVIGPQDAPSNIQTRIEGFKTVYPEFLFVDQSLTREGGKQAAEKIIASEISAVFALNDEIALGLMYQLKHLGKVIPNDYSIVGYDNSPMSEYVTPALTTVSQPIFELGQIAAKLLLERIRDPKKAWARKVLPVELIKRNTTAHLK